MSSELDTVLVNYFKSWRPYKVILARLEIVHGLKRSTTWLKNQFKRLGLEKRGVYAPDGIVRNCIMRELRSSNCQLGYRAMWKLLRDKYIIKTKRDTVMMIMREMDPVGVQLRRSRRLQRRIYLSKGPNFCWHLDGYDKLSPFGFHIHGCMDGFSRKILWLKVASTNNDPSVVLQYFLETVENQKGCPSIVRMDRGTENGQVATTQIAFRSQHSDSLNGHNSIRYGASPANVRIESWWSILRRHKTGWWIDTFKELELSGNFDHSCEHDKQCLAIVFFGLLERELQEFVQYWNSHTLRKNQVAGCPQAIPNDLYDMPQYYSGEECIKSADSSIWAHAMINHAHSPDNMYSDDLYRDCQELVQDNLGINLHSQVNASNAVSIYNYIVNNT